MSEMKEKDTSKKYKLDKLNASNVVDEIFEYYELELEDLAPEKPVNGIGIENSQIEEDAYRATKMTYDRLVRFAMRGRIETKESDEFLVIQHLRKPLRDGRTTITWHEPTAGAKVQMKRANEKDAHGRMLYFMAAVSKELDANVLGQLRGPDMSLMECIAAVFFIV